MTKNIITNQFENVADSHVFKTVNFVEFLQWSHLLKCAGAETLCEFGCKDGSMIELRYRNRVAPSSYIGLCTETTTRTAIETAWNKLPWVQVRTVNLSDGGDDYSAFTSIEADAVIALNVPVGITSIDFLHYMENFYLCGHQDTTYTILLPKSTDLLTELEIASVINTYFTVISRYGVNGKVQDFIPAMNDWQQHMYEGLTPYYNKEMLSASMSPFFPDQCPQQLWKLKRKIINP